MKSDRMAGRRGARGSRMRSGAKASTERVSTRAMPLPWRADGRALCVEKRRTEERLTTTESVEHYDRAPRASTDTREPEKGERFTAAQRRLREFLCVGAGRSVGRVLPRGICQAAKGERLAQRLSLEERPPSLVATATHCRACPAAGHGRP